MRVCVCVCVCEFFTLSQFFTPLQRLYVYLCMCVYACMYLFVRISVCMYVCIYVYIVLCVCCACVVRVLCVCCACVVRVLCVCLSVCACVLTISSLPYNIRKCQSQQINVFLFNKKDHRVRSFWSGVFMCALERTCVCVHCMCACIRTSSCICVWI